MLEKTKDELQTRYHMQAKQIADLVTKKQQAYGNSFGTAGAAMRLLYPNGISPEQLDDALTLVRIWDKMMRIATAKDAFGENPYADIMGYALLAVERGRIARLSMNQVDDES